MKASASVGASQPHPDRLPLIKAAPLHHPSKFLREISMLGRRRRRRRRLRRHIGYVPLFKFYQLGNHREARLRVGHPRIVFASELLHHPLKVNSGSLDPIVN